MTMGVGAEPVPTRLPSAEPAPLGRGTLGRKLMIRVVALVAAAAILLGLLTTLATRQLLLGQLDRQLVEVLTLQQQYRGGGGGGGGGRPPPGGVRVPGQRIGTLAAEFPTGSTPSIGVLRGNRADITLSDDQPGTERPALHASTPSRG